MTARSDSRDRAQRKRNLARRRRSEGHWTSPKRFSVEKRGYLRLWWLEGPVPNSVVGRDPYRHLDVRVSAEKRAMK